jgi:hypothetical protein
MELLYIGIIILFIAGAYYWRKAEITKFRNEACNGTLVVIYEKEILINGEIIASGVDKVVILSNYGTFTRDRSQIWPQ